MATVVILFLIGCVFLFAGVTKVVYSRPFIVHIRNLGILPRSLNETAASLFIQLECAIGGALVLYVFPGELIPILIGLILGLSILSAWGVASGRVDDCGCYGGWLNLSLKQSLGLNAIYLLLLIVSWRLQENDPPVLMWKVGVVVGIIILSNFLIRRSANSPLFDISPIQVGRRWQSQWVTPEYLNGDPVAYLYIFMAHRCQMCRSWQPYVTNLLGRAGMPLPVLVFPDDSGDMDIWDETIPVQKIKPVPFRYLVYRTPTAVLVKNGRIENKWVARFPEEFI
ncbi:hypothetical protein KKI24_16375 [bacterium]|nr:hypothetical protein [bacterium]